MDGWFTLSEGKFLFDLASKIKGGGARGTFADGVHELVTEFLLFRVRAKGKP